MRSSSVSVNYERKSKTRKKKTWTIWLQLLVRPVSVDNYSIVFRVIKVSTCERASQCSICPNHQPFRLVSRWGRIWRMNLKQVRQWICFWSINVNPAIIAVEPLNSYEPPMTLSHLRLCIAIVKWVFLCLIVTKGAYELKSRNLRGSKLRQLACYANLITFWKSSVDWH